MLCAYNCETVPALEGLTVWWRKPKCTENCYLSHPLVGILQRNRTNTVCTCIKRDLLQGINSHDYGGWDVLRPAVCKLNTQEELKFQLESKGRGKTKVPARRQSVEGRPFVLYGPPVTGWGPPTRGAPSTLLSVLFPVFVVPRNILTTHPESCFTKCLCTCVPVQLTHKISRHSVHCYYREINQVPLKVIPSRAVREGFEGR